MMENIGKAIRGRKGGAGRGGAQTSEEEEWHNKPLQERLQILRSRQGVPSFIDPATIDDRIKWLQEEIQSPGGLSARPEGQRGRRRGENDGIGGGAAGGAGGAAGRRAGPGQRREGEAGGTARRGREAGGGQRGEGQS